LYRIHTVSAMSGVTAATLRAWERRYGVPSPARTASAYRLYGEQDVEIILRMRDLVKHGMAAAEAARTVLCGGSADNYSSMHAPDPFAAARDRIVEATVRFDPEAIDAEVNKTLILGSAVSIFDRALGPAPRSDRRSLA
jgi:DNA-binding transcriptional MerR regulator